MNQIREQVSVFTSSTSHTKENENAIEVSFSPFLDSPTATGQRPISPDFISGPLITNNSETMEGRSWNF